MKPEYLSSEEFEKRKNMKLFKLLNNEDFWERLNLVSLNSYRVTRLREYRTKLIIPNKKFLSNFIDEDYRIITKEERETREVILDLLSYESEEFLEKLPDELGADKKETSVNLQEAI